MRAKHPLLQKMPPQIRSNVIKSFLIAFFAIPMSYTSHAAIDSASHVGMNYALALQKNELDTTVAASILSKKFPSLQKAKLFGSSERDMKDAEALLNVGIKKITVAIRQKDVWNNTTSTSIVDDTYAKNFVDTVVKPLVKKGATISVAVGNEPFAYWHDTPGNVLLSAYRNVRTALIEAGLKQSVEMMIPFQMGITKDSYPASNAVIRDEYRPAIKELLDIMYEDGDPFEVNIYPYFAYRDNVDVIPLDYALGIPGGSEQYGSLFEAMHAAIEYALLKLHSNFTKDNLIVVGEVGWPTEDKYFPSEANGWRNDTGFPYANVENATVFINNVLATGIPVYIFEAFDEQGKSVDDGAGDQFSNVENHWGIFTEAGDLKYDVPILMASPNYTVNHTNMLNVTQQDTSSGSSSRTCSVTSRFHIFAAVSLAISYLSSF